MLPERRAFELPFPFLAVLYSSGRKSDAYLCGLGVSAFCTFNAEAQRYAETPNAVSRTKGAQSEQQ